MMADEISSREGKSENYKRRKPVRSYELLISIISS